ncbi:MAG TPA: hypothetical protein PKY19_01485 [Oscillospiraceae bacterium]|nr:hypothetical protein [Oscillospiraceae bacterium]HXK77142.1 hypothetical protein [Oscillospiraceae bacterium]
MDRKKEFFKRILKAVVGLEIFSIGIYFFIQANIGLPPWDVLSMGISYRVPGLTYGDACTIVSLLVLGIDLLLKERLGFGSLLDALLVGKSVDLWAWVGFLPEQSTVWVGILFALISLFIMCYGMYFYMDAGLCCGPRDSLMVAIGRRLPKAKIGLVVMLINAVVLVGGYFLGGPIGLGTLIEVLCAGSIMNFVFKLMKFEPRDVAHEDFLQSLAHFRKMRDPAA